MNNTSIDLRGLQRENLHHLKYIDKEDLVPEFSKLIKQSKSVACLMYEDQLLKIGEDTWKLSSEGKCTLSSDLKDRLKVKNLNPGKEMGTKYLRFKNEPCPGSSTGFLVQKNQKKTSNKGTKYFVTAAHCIGNKKTQEVDHEMLKKIRVVFDFAMTMEKKINKKFSSVYEIEKVVDFEWDESKKSDWALVKLNKAVKNRSPLKLEKNPKNIKKWDKVYVLGHPWGLPLKYIGNSKIYKFVKNSAYTSLESFGGTSGSPVFNEAGMVVGILTEGSDEYSFDINTNEIVEELSSNLYPSTLTRIGTVWKKLNPPQKVQKVVTKMPKDEKPSFWQEVKGTSKEIATMPYVAFDDFCEAPSLGTGLKAGLSLVVPSATVTALGCLLVPVTVASTPLMLVGTGIAGAAATFSAVFGYGVTKTLVQKL